MGRTHQKVQEFLLASLPNQEGILECPFKEIGRIADLAWLEEKIVFEVQFSPMNALEARSRTRDYTKIGWSVVWILHENIFNPLRPTPFQQFLSYFPHYYTNLDDLMGGDIFDYVKGQKRVVDLSKPKINSRILFPRYLKERRHWKIHFHGDFLDSLSLLHLFNEW